METLPEILLEACAQAPAIDVLPIARHIAGGRGVGRAKAGIAPASQRIELAAGSHFNPGPPNQAEIAACLDAQVVTRKDRATFARLGGAEIGIGFDACKQVLGDVEVITKADAIKHAILVAIGRIKAIPAAVSFDARAAGKGAGAAGSGNACKAKAGNERECLFLHFLVSFCWWSGRKPGNARGANRRLMSRLEALSRAPTA
jgi:hypothetical protein